jgi:hypothetical protein
MGVAALGSPVMGPPPWLPMGIVHGRLQISKAFSRKVLARPANLVAACVALGTVACFATWFVAIALKMEGNWAVRWSAVSFPVWLTLGLLALFSGIAILGELKPVYGWMTLVSPSAVVRAWVPSPCPPAPPSAPHAGHVLHTVPHAQCHTPPTVPVFPSTETGGRRGEAGGP